MVRRLILPLGALGLLLMAGCPSVANLTTAKPLGKGRHQLAVSPSALGVSLNIVGDNEATLDHTYVPVVDVQYRVGVHDIVDLGVTWQSYTNVMFDVKVSLLQTEVIGLAVDPSAGGYFLAAGDGAAGFLQYVIPLLVDFYAGDAVTITVSPRFQGLFLFAGDSDSSASNHQNLFGGTLGVEFAVSEMFSIMPHGGIVYWLNAPESVVPSIFTGGVAFKFGFGGRHR